MAAFEPHRVPAPTMAALELRHPADDERLSPVRLARASVAGAHAAEWLRNVRRAYHAAAVARDLR